LRKINIAAFDKKNFAALDRGDLWLLDGSISAYLATMQSELDGFAFQFSLD
jgi:hypothetical protein